MARDEPRGFYVVGGEKGEKTADADCPGEDSCDGLGLRKSFCKVKDMKGIS